MHLSRLLSTTLLFAPALVAQRFAEIEPNDLVAQAQVVAMGTQIDASIGIANDIDWYRFTTPAGNVRMYVNGALDTELELRDGTGTTVLAFSDDARVSQSDLSINLAAGTYTIRVKHFSTSTGPYSLDLGVIAAKPFNGVEIEPNNSLLTAQPITNGAQLNCSLSATQFVPVIVANPTVSVSANNTYTLALGSWLKTPQAGNILTFSGFTDPANNGMKLVTAATATTITVSIVAPYAPLVPEPAGGLVTINAGDEDWYMITLTTQSNLWIQVTEGQDTCIPRSRFEIYDALGAPVNAATLGLQSGNSSDFNFRQSLLRVWPAGVYHVVIKQTNSTGTIGTTLSPFQNYRLELLVQPMHTGATVPEGAEPNSTAATATPLAPGQVGTGNISLNTGTDVSDWWGPFTFNGPRVITYQTTQGAGSPLLDSTIIVRDGVTGAALITVMSGNILTTTSHARSTTIGSLPLTFYLEVMSPGAAAGQSGDYRLEVSSIDVLPYVSAGYAIFAANTACGIVPRPVLSTQFTNERPTLGTTFSRSVGVTPASAPCILVQGFVALPTAFDMTPLGAPSCTVNVTPTTTTFFVADPSGTTILNQNTPTSLALRGLPVFEQVAVLVPAANALGIQVTNFARQILGERSY
jgi:hypothetical protein